MDTTFSKNNLQVKGFFDKQSALISKIKLLTFTNVLTVATNKQYQLI